MKTDRIAQAAFDLIVDFETGGRAYYERQYKSAPCWPGGASGVTIGCGYDLGYEESFARDWAGVFPAAEQAALARCIGKRGQRARQALSGVGHIRIPWDVALRIFEAVNLPQEIRLTLSTFKHADRVLTRNAFGALVSLVFNRGSSCDDSPRRAEMRRIRAAIADAVAHPYDPPHTPDAADNLHLFLAAHFRAMKRLWHDNPRSDGDLCDRREREAQLILTPDSAE